MKKACNFTDLKKKLSKMLKNKYKKHLREQKKKS